MEKLPAKKARQNEGEQYPRLVVGEPIIFGPYDTPADLAASFTRDAKATQEDPDPGVIAVACFVLLALVISLYALWTYWLEPLLTTT